MPTIKVAAGVVNQTPMSWKSNLENILTCISDAKQKGVSLLCMPEFCVSGYACEDYFFAPDLAHQSLKILHQIVEHTEGIIVAIGLPLLYRGRLYNAACLVADKRILGFYCKQFLANNGVHYETRWFHAWPKNVVEEISIDGQDYPIGDVLFTFNEGTDDLLRVSFEICEDAWVADRPGKRHYERGVDVILNPSASHFGFNKFRTRERLVQEGSRAFNCSYVYTNLLGNESGSIIFDGDAMIASNGNMLASGPRFSYEDYFVLPAVIDTSATRLSQIQNRIDLASNQDTFYWDVPASFDFPKVNPVIDQKADLEPFERGGFIKEEEFARAVSLGLFDYLRKSRSNGFTISLSGGADSSACAALCKLMLRLADESIGLEGIKRKLGYIKGVKEATSLADLTKQLVQTIYQGTKNSSDDTFESARELAEDIGATFYHINIDNLVSEYHRLIESQLGRSLSWETDDIAMQNIQARVRAPGVWMLANVAGNLLLATSNRSEVAVGYATMDGDTAGSISPIAGIDKVWLRQWLIWLQTKGCEVKGKQICVEGLARVNGLQPTAELRPADRKQTDEADLMPYDVLNSLEQLAIRDKKSPIECFRTIVVKYSESWSATQLRDWTVRFFQLWSRNQWKRERYAPSFHLDDYNLNPRSWARFPILSGGFALELEELKALSI